MKKRHIISIISFLFFLIITILVLINKVNSLDESIYHFIMNYRSKVLDNFFVIITEFANPIPVIIIFTMLVIALKRKEEIILSVNLLTTLTTNQLLKRIIMRPRPDHLRIVKESGFSYPSGHAMMSLCLYGTLIYLIIKRMKNKKIKILLISLLSLLILLIGFSRIYVGVHYPTDVIGGYFLTIAIVTEMITLTNNRLRGKKKHDKDGNK